jgi:HEAT repeat protein
VGVAALGDPDPAVRLAAIETLSGLTARSPAAHQGIAGAVGDPDAKVREAAREALRRFSAR